MAITDPTTWPERYLRLVQTDDHADVAVQRNKHTQDALSQHKKEGLELAVRARIIAMAIIAVMMLFLVPWPDVLYYELILVLFVIIGIAQRQVGRVGTSRAELMLLFCDLFLMTIVVVIPNPLSDLSWPLPFQYKFETFKYFFILLATATLMYSWRTIIAVGIWTTTLWIIGVLSVGFFSADPALWRNATEELYRGNDVLIEMLDPTRIGLDIRVQEIVVFLLVTAVLAVSVRRSNNLLLAQAAVERERANLARYFSPNVVDQLSKNDEPLKQVVEQEIAVLFVDIVGFTTYASEHSPKEVIRTLREFHARMEREVFRQNGTLDKYLGDGLMATFGTPFAGDTDALDALTCAKKMSAAVDDWNQIRSEAGQRPIRASFGVHAGPVVLGDIGANRLEFAVIGNTVNVSSRLEALSRPLDVRIVASDALMRRAKAQAGKDVDVFDGMRRVDHQEIRGLSEPINVWTMH